jgi:hypothetical protein
MPEHSLTDEARFIRQDSGDGKRAFISGPVDSEEPLQIEVDTDDVWLEHVENQITALLACLNEHYVEPPLPPIDDD